MNKLLPWALVALAAGCQTARLREKIITQTVAVHIADTVRIHDSAVVVHAIATTDSLRDTLLVRLTDTLTVKRYILRVDTLKAACQACIASAARASIINAALNNTNAQLVKRLDSRPSYFQQLMGMGIALIVGAALLLGVQTVRTFIR